MAEARKIITDFTGGEVGDRLMARIDTSIYNRTCRILENFIVHAGGGLDFAPGTVFICEAKTNTGPVRLLPFEVSASEKYVLELSESACRFYKNKAQLMDGANPLEIITPWLGADLFGLQTAQQESKAYLAHGSYQLHGLKTYGDLLWSLASADLDVCLAVGHGTTPCITVYSYYADVFTKRPNPDVLPSTEGRGCAFSRDGIYLAVAHSAGTFITIYKRSGDTFTKLANPGTLPPLSAYGCAFSSNGLYLAVAHDNTPFVTIYKRSGDVFTKLANPDVLPASHARGCAFSADGVYLAVAHDNTPFVTIYKRSGDVFTKLANPGALPTNISYGCAFSADGVYLAVGHATTPFVTIYKRSGDVFTKLANPGTLPTGTGYGCIFSEDGMYLAVAHATTPFVTIYKRSGGTFTKLANPAALPAGIGRGCTFSANGVYLAVAHDVSPYITNYKRSGDTFTKLADPGTLPSGMGYCCAFVPDAWEGVSWGSQYPAALTFHDQRLILGRGQKVRGSRTGWPQNFLLDATDDAAAYEYTLASDVLEEIVWMKTKDHRIVIGTSHGEWLMSGGDAPITGANVYTDRVSAHGNAGVGAILANESLLFVQKGGQRLREFMYSMERGGYISPDLTQLADHIGEDVFVDLAWQRSPRSMLWTIRATGELAALTLDRNNGIVAWARHPRDGLVKSIAVVSGDATNPEDTIYLCVQRVIDGVTKQYIEYMKPINRPADEDDYHFVDCGKIYDYSATTDAMTGATKATPVVVTAGAHPFVNNEFVRITGVVGMTQLNGNTYMVKNKAAGTFELYLTDGTTPLNGTAFGTYVSGGLCEKVVKDLSGLDHLKLKTVAIYADGETLDQEVVFGGITWTIRSSAADNDWYGVAYGAGLFVAVAATGTGNRVMTSPDGITWTIRTSAADNSWASIAYGNGLFVAVAVSGTGNRVMTSPDGITWTIRTSAANNYWFSVAYGNGLFVAVAVSGTGDRVMTSPDGITWTLRTSAADNSWASIAYGNGLFVAVATSGTGDRVMTSPDGITWTIRSSAADNDWYGVAYGNGVFVAVAGTGTGDRVMTSPDGITWTIRNSAANNNWFSVAYGNGLFATVACSGTGNRVMISDADSITIDEYAAKIHVGLPYTGRLWTQRLGGFSPVRIPEATLLLYKSRGGRIGADAGSLKNIRYASDTLLTGPQEVRIGGAFSREGSIMIVQDQPLPMTVLGIVAEIVAGE